MQYNTQNLTDRQTGRIDSLAGARFPAIMIIVICHFEFLRQYGDFGNIYWNYFKNATMGVNFFFMLSGFGMMLSSMRKDPAGVEPIGGVKGLISFGIKHIEKIYPVYVAFLVFGIPYYLLSCLDAGQKLSKALIKTALFFLFDLTLLQSATGHLRFSHSLNGVCWFLSSLFCIYLVSPVIIKYLKKTVKTIRAAVIGIILSIMISVILAVVFGWIDEHTIFNDLCYGSPYRRVFYVIPGMLIAQIYVFTDNNPSCRQQKGISNGLFEYITMCVSMIWFFLRHSASPIGPFIYVFDMIIVSCDLLALAWGKGAFSKLFSSSGMVYLGSVSMYIFLSHYNIRNYVDYIVQRQKIESLETGIVEVIIILLLTFIISTLIHHFRSQKNNYTQPPRIKEK